MNCYRKILGQIIAGEQPRMKEYIDMRFKGGYEFEERTIYSFESMRIWEALIFLEDYWEDVKRFLV